jgi:sucrose-6F-phosphate phosphohydrolase
VGAGSVVLADVDGTLLGDDGALERFAGWYADAQPGWRLIYATGRLRPSLATVIAETALPEPDVVISGVGTEIHEEGGRPFPGWAERFEAWDGDAVRAALATIDWLEPQGAIVQTRLKASYDVPGLDRAGRTEIADRLEQAGLEASLVYSSGLHLDVLPADAGKGRAARHVTRTWGMAPRDVLAFGDSGNDLGLFGEGFRGTVVANVLPELDRLLGPSVYRSPLPFADGVLDGIRRWTGERAGTHERLPDPAQLSAQGSV